VLNS
jgi:hypothetical protein